MSITPSTLVSKSTIPPSSIEDLWEPELIFAPDWASGVTLTRVWATTVLASRSAAEARRGRVGRPRRLITFTLKAMRDVDTGRVSQQFVRWGMARNPIPMYTDFLQVIEPPDGPSNPNEIQIGEQDGQRLTIADFNTRQWEVGSRLVFVERQGAMSDTFLWTVLDAIVTFSGSVEGFNVTPNITPDVGYRVFPVMECLPLLQSQVDLLCATGGQSEVTFEEVVGDSAFPALASPNTTPSGFDEYDGLPIFDLSPDWTSMRVGYDRIGEYYSLGIERIAFSSASKPRFMGEMSFTGLQRSVAVLLRSFFDSRCGRCFTFFLPNHSADLIVVDRPSTTSADLRADVLPTAASFFRTYIAFRSDDGTITVREIDSITDQGSGVIRVTWTGDIATNASIVKASWCHKVRFDSDEMKEVWTTDYVMQTEFSVVEVLEEKTVETSVSSPRGSSYASWYSPSTSTSAPGSTSTPASSTSTPASSTSTNGTYIVA